MNIGPFWNPGRHSPPGYSFLEVLTVIALVGILAAIASTHYQETLRSASTTKLETDVSTINRSIQVYLASGGSLDRLNDPQAILDKMKTFRTAESDTRYVGFSGSMIDPRLAARMVEGEDSASSSSPRAVWNPAKFRFEISNHGSGVLEFRAVDSLATVVQAEHRLPSAFSYNTANGWIWPYSDHPPLPGPVATSHLEQDHTSPAEEATSEPTPWTQASPSLLLPPNFSIIGGTRPLSNYPLNLALSNPNPSESSWIYLSVNGGPFANYVGPLEIDPTTEVAALVRGEPYLWITSPTVRQTYVPAPRIPLATPLIESSHPRFEWFEAETITVQLVNPNDPSISSLEIRFNDQSWQPYTTPFSLPLAEHRDGVLVSARAVPRTVDHVISDMATREIGGASPPVELQPPAIHPSSPHFAAGTHETITIDIANPNGPGSALDYRLNGGSWSVYGSPFAVTRSQHPTDLLVEARARATSPAFLDSPTASTVIGHVSRPPAFQQFCTSRLSQAGVTVIGGAFRLSHSESGVFGSVSIAPGATWNISAGFVTGEFQVHPGTTGSLGSCDDQPGTGGTPTTAVPTDLTGIGEEAIAISNAAAALPATRTFAKIDKPLTISATASDGVNVIQITEISLSGGAVITLSGGSGDYFILNISKSVKMSGGSTWALSSGLDPSRVMINMLPGATEFSGTGGTNVRSGGIILAPHSSTAVTITGASMIEANVVAGKGFTSTGGSQVLAATCSSSLIPAP